MNYFTACGIYHAEVEAMLRAVDQVQGVTLAVHQQCIAAVGLPSIVGAVFTALVLGAGPRGEPIAAFRALPLDHSWKRFPGLGIDRARGRFIIGQWRPLRLVTAHWPLSPRLARSHTLLQRLRRIGQAHAGGGCRDCVQVLLQDQEYLDPVFPPDFRT